MESDNQTRRHLLADNFSMVHSGWTGVDGSILNDCSIIHNRTCANGTYNSTLYYQVKTPSPAFYY